MWLKRHNPYSGMLFVPGMFFFCALPLLNERCILFMMDSCSGLLRVSPYFYNTIEENAIAEILGSRRNKRRTVMLCPNCNAGCSPDDQYCRRCGTDLTVPSTSLVPAQSSLPAILQPQLPRLAAGVGAVAVGVGVGVVVGPARKALRTDSIMLSEPFTSPLR